LAFPKEGATITKEVTSLRKKLSLQMLSQLNIDFHTDENRAKQLPPALEYVIDRVVHCCQGGATPPDILEEMKSAWMEWSEISPLLFEMACHGNFYPSKSTLQKLVKANKKTKDSHHEATKVGTHPLPGTRAFHPYPVPVLTERHKPQYIKAFPRGKTQYSEEELVAQHKLVAMNFDAWGIEFPSMIQQSLHRNAAISYAIGNASKHAQVSQRWSAQSVCAIIWNSLLDWEDVSQSLLEDNRFTIENPPAVADIDLLVQQRKAAFSSNKIPDHMLEVGLQAVMEEAQRKEPASEDGPQKTLDEEASEGLHSVGGAEMTDNETANAQSDEFKLPPHQESSEDGTHSKDDESSGSQTALLQEHENTMTDEQATTDVQFRNDLDISPIETHTEASVFQEFDNNTEETGMPVACMQPAAAAPAAAASLPTESSLENHPSVSDHLHLKSHCVVCIATVFDVCIYLKYVCI